MTHSAEGDSSYGNDMTDVANTNVSYDNGSMTVTNGSYSGELEKADAGKAADIEEALVRISRHNCRRCWPTPRSTSSSTRQ